MKPWVIKKHLIAKGKESKGITQLKQMLKYEGRCALIQDKTDYCILGISPLSSQSWMLAQKTANPWHEGLYREEGLEGSSSRQVSL